MNKIQLAMIAKVVARNEGNRKKLGMKPEKGDWVQDVYGKIYMIHSINKGYVYADTGTTEREVFTVAELSPDHNQNLWVMKKG